MNDVNIELFENYPESSFRLIAILDIDLKYPNYFNALFEDIDTRKPYLEHIIPELFRKKFKIGNVYRNNEVVELGDYLQGKFFITTNVTDKYEKLGDITTEYPYFINDYFSKYLNKQLCYIYDVDNLKLIIPANIIAIRYYFLSSSFKRAYNDGDLSNLYHVGSNKYFSEEDKYQIDIKRANKKDIPFICRFLKDDYAYDSFAYFFKNKSNTYMNFNLKDEESFNSTLLCRFPLKDSFNIHCRYIPLEGSIDDKKVYLVTDIYTDESPLGFSSLHIRKYKSGTPQGEIDNTPYVTKKFKGRKRGKPSTNTIINGNPTGNIMPSVLINEAQKDLNTTNLKITNENMFTGDGATIETNSEDVNTVPSFNGINDTNQSSEYIQQILCKEIEKMDSPFLLSHFMILFEELRQDPSVLDSYISDVKLIDKIPNKARSGFNDKSLLNKDEYTPRPYLYGFIQHNDKFVYIIEIQEDATWSQSTWFFVSDEYVDFNKNITFNIIKKYIRSLSYSELYKYCYSKYELSLFIKKHTKKIYSEDRVEDWCEDVFKLTDLTNDERYGRFE